MNTPAQPSARQRTSSMLLIGGLIGNAVGHSLFLMTFPALSREMGMTDVQAGLVVGLSALVLMLSAPVWGWVSERRGRRPVVVLAMFATSGGLGLSALVIYWGQAGVVSALTAFTMILTVRLLYAALSGGLKPSAQAMMADMTDADSRARGMGLMGAAFGIGTLIGGLLAVLFGGGSLIRVFLIATTLLLINALMQWRRLSETYPDAAVSRAPIAAFRLGEFWPYLLFTLLGLTVYSLLQQVTVLRIQDDFGLASGPSIQRSGGVLMTATLAMVVTQGLVVRGLTWRPVVLILVGAGLATGALTAAALATGLAALWLAMALFGAGVGLILPGNLAAMSLLAGPHRQGRLAGINGLGMGLGMAIGPVLGAAAHQWHVSAPYWIAVSLCLCLFLIAWLRVPRARPSAMEAARV